MTEPELSVVIPAFNEQDNVRLSSFPETPSNAEILHLVAGLAHARRIDNRHRPARQR